MRRTGGGVGHGDDNHARVGHDYRDIAGVAGYLRYRLATCGDHGDRAVGHDSHVDRRRRVAGAHELFLPLLSGKDTQTPAKLGACSAEHDLSRVPVTGPGAARAWSES